MAQCGNNFLCNQNLAADGAVLALGQTGCGTGCCNSLINDLGMGDHLCFIRNIAVATDGAGVGGVALCGTGGRGYDCCVAMSGYRNHFLRNHNLAADGAVLAFGQTGCGTGCCNSLINDLGMGDHLCFIRNIAVATDGAGVGGVALCGTGGRGYDCCVAMSGYRNHFLRNHNLAADGAVLAFGQAGFSTGGCDGCVDHFGVIQLCDFLGVAVAAVCTGVGHGACFRAACCLGHSAFIVVTQSFNNSLCNQNLTAGRAVATLSQTGFSTGGGNCIVSDYSVVGHGGEGCGVGCVAGYGNGVFVPAFEGVGGAAVFFLGGSFALVFGDGAVGNGSFSQHIVAVLPSDGVGSQHGSEFGGVGCVTGDGSQLGRPTGEGIGVLGIFLLDRGIAGVCGSGAAVHSVSAQKRSISIIPGDGCLLDGATAVGTLVVFAEVVILLCGRSAGVGVITVYAGM